MQIIPAIDIINGKCVRLTEGDFSRKKIYNENPLEVAKQFEAAGLHRLHLVDLDGARAGTVRNWNVLEQIALKTTLEIDFGGGIKTEKDLETAFNSGASMITIGSLAVIDKPELTRWIHKYNPNRFFLGADVKNKKLAINGWQEITKLPLYDFIQDYLAHGVKQFFCTDISKDGKLQGPAINLYKSTVEKFPAINLIASGGVSSLNDIQDLKQAGCSGVIIGKAIYEKLILLKDLKDIAC